MVWGDRAYLDRVRVTAEGVQGSSLRFFDQGNGVNSRLFRSLQSLPMVRLCSAGIINRILSLTFKVRSMALSDQTAGTLRTNSFSQSSKYSFTPEDAMMERACL